MLGSTDEGPPRLPDGAAAIGRRWPAAMNIKMGTPSHAASPSRRGAPEVGGRVEPFHRAPGVSVEAHRARAQLHEPGCGAKDALQPNHKQGHATSKLTRSPTHLAHTAHAHTLHTAQIMYHFFTLVAILHWPHGVVGHHVRFTCGRSPVRTWMRLLTFLFSFSL